MRSLRPVMCGVVTGLLTLACLVATPPAMAPAHASTKPGDGKLRALGKAYGHGRGLSQWGARNAARKGVGYKRILTFYYPGTRLRASRPPRPLRVRLGHRGTPISVDAERRMTLFWTAQNRRVRSRILPSRVGGCRVALWRVARVRGSDLTLRARGCGRWRTFLAPGAVWGGGRISFSPGDGTFRVRRHRPGSTPTHREYRGELRTTIRAGRLRAINLVPIEAYLRAVVPSESPASWPREALKAQAVAARTYARWNMSHPRGSYFDVYDTTMSQKYPGRRELTSKWRTIRGFEHARTNAAIRRTHNVIVTYRGKPAFTEYSASNGGRTVAGTHPYVKSRKDPWDRGVQWRAYRGQGLRDPELRDPGPGEPESKKAGPEKAEPGEPEPGKAEPGKAEPGKPEPGKPEPGKPEPGKPEPEKAEPEKAEPGKPEPGKPHPDELELGDLELEDPGPRAGE